MGSCPRPNAYSCQPDHLRRGTKGKVDYNVFFAIFQKTAGKGSRPASAFPSAGSMWVSNFHGIRACQHSEHAPTALAESAVRRCPSCPPPAGCAVTFLRFFATCEISAVSSLFAHPSVMEMEFEVWFLQQHRAGASERLASSPQKRENQDIYSPLYIWCSGRLATNNPRTVLFVLDWRLSR